MGPGDRIFHININVSRLDRSIDFYQRLGFRVLHRERLDPRAMQQTLAAMGVPAGNGAEYALVRLGDHPGAACLDLVQWDDMVDAPPVRLNERGVCRIAIHVDDGDALRAAVAAAGFDVVNPRGLTAAGREAGIVLCLRDPDGVFLEFVTGLDPLLGSPAP